MPRRVSLVCSALAALVLVLPLTGCGGGSGAPGTAVLSPRSDGKVAIVAHVVTLVDDAGVPTTRTLSTPAVLGAPGQEVSLAVTASDVSGLAGAAIKLDLDKRVFACSDVTPGSWVTPQAQLVKNAVTAAIAVAGAAACGAGSSPTVVATFRLRILPAAAPQNASVNLTAVLADAKGNTLGRMAGRPPATVRPQGTSNLVGDLMGSGQPEVGSAIKILRVVVGLDAGPAAANLWQWDCNSNLTVDVADAIMILRCVVGLDTWPIAGGPPMSYGQRQAARDAIATFKAGLMGVDRNADNTALASFMSSRPEFRAAGVSSDGCVWGCYRDNRFCIVVNNDDPSATPLSAPQQQQMLPQDVRSGTPHGKKARLLRSMGTAFPNSVPDIQGYLTSAAAGYTLSGGSASVAGLKAVAGDSIFYVHGHGGSPNIWNTKTNAWDHAQYALWTLDKVSAANDAAFWADLTAQSVGEMFATQDAGAPSEWHYCITPAFVTQYMSFGENSFVCIHGCSGNNPAFKSACLAKGASLYAAWTNPVMSDDSRRASLFIFDRMAGANQYSPEDPKQRPFDYNSVWTDLDSRGWDWSHSPGYTAAQFVMTPATAGDCGILTPSIQNLGVDDVSADDKGTLTINGLFGQDPGAANRSVKVGGIEMNHVYWASDNITCDLPLSGAGASGDCVVSVYGHDSNKVPLTDWVMSFNYVFHGSGSQQYTINMDKVHFRADVHQRRTAIHQSPAPTSVDFADVADSAASYTCSGSDSNGNVWSGSGQIGAARHSGTTAQSNLEVFGSINNSTHLMKMTVTAIASKGLIITDKHGVKTQSGVTLFLSDVDPLNPPPVFTLDPQYNIQPGQFTFKNGGVLSWSQVSVDSWPDPTMYPASVRAGFLDSLLPWLRRLS